MDDATVPPAPPPASLVRQLTGREEDTATAATTADGDADGDVAMAAAKASAPAPTADAPSSTASTGAQAGAGAGAGAGSAAADTASGDGADTATGGDTGSAEAGATAATASAPAAAAAPAFRYLTAGITDPGVPGKVNQDTFFIWDKDPSRERLVIAVFDGHGREMGRLAALTASASMKAQFDSEATWAEIEADPKAAFVRIFNETHAAVKQAFINFYKEQGWSVSEGAEGFLLRRRHDAQAWMCVHGGTTATVAAMVRGRRVVVANVGDSTAILAGVSADDALRPVSEWSAPEADAKRTVAGRADYPRAAVTQLSQDHSPENPDEFKRMRNFRPCPHRKHHPELLFVYDTLSSSKLSCPPIFVLDSEGNPSATNRGAYYKNVRNEWATLVAVPPFARFQDALAFTRSIGDFHLQTYGVSHTPDVVWFDLGAAPGPAGDAGAGAAATGGDSTADAGAGGSGAGSAPAAATSAPIALVMCSDGVWDNWKFDDLSEFVLNPARCAKAVSGQAGTQEATNDLMVANLDRGRMNFGNSADNMTALVTYLIRRE